MAKKKRQALAKRTGNTVASTLVKLPHELMWRIFSIYLVATKWAGWPTLLQLSKDLEKRLRRDIRLIRTILPSLHGGILQTLNWLLNQSKKIEILDRRQHILWVINGVASGLSFDDDRTFTSCVLRANAYTRDPEMIYVSLMRLASQVSWGHLIGNSWSDAIGGMKLLKEKPEEADEYERCVRDRRRAL